MLKLLGALHGRGFHPAVLAALVMMPAVVAVGFLTDYRPAVMHAPRITAQELRGSFDAAGPVRTGERS